MLDKRRKTLRMTAKTATISEMNFEDALSELETIVKSMESGGSKLEDSIKSYERGIELRKHCESKLREAQEKIEKITMTENGSLATEPFAEEE